MSVSSYIYFDDEKPESVKPYIDSVVELFDDGHELLIHHMSPRPWDEQIQIIRSGGYTGIILDLRLDIQGQWEGLNIGKKAQYRAEELAQKIRVDATEGNIQDVPIVLWSTTQNLNNSGFKRDSTPKDLFDFKVIKTSIPNKATHIRAKLISLSDGYSQISNYYEGDIINIGSCLGLKDSEVEFTDPRVLHYFNVDFKPPVHDVARYILEHIIRHPGFLISESLLAIRMGVDIEKSANWRGFSNLLFTPFQYQGVFGSGWKRFILNEIINWWQEKFYDNKNLKLLDSSERVRLLNEAYKGYGLVELEKTEDDESAKFWHECIATGLPVTQRSAFITHDPHRLPWQENRYISKSAIRQRLDKHKGISVDQLDSERLNKFKAEES